MYDIIVGKQESDIFNRSTFKGAIYEPAYRLKVGWVIADLISNAILLTAAIASFWLRKHTLAPEVFGYVSSLTRDNPHVPLPEGGTTLSGWDRARLLRDSQYARERRRFILPSTNLPNTSFQKYAHNPIISPNSTNNFESAFTYNPTAIVLNDTIFLLYRAQNATKTSSVGLAWSTDGFNFTRLTHPIFYATEPYETIGGTEDPRIVRINGTFYLTYTAFNNVTAQLCIAHSTNLVDWTKIPPLFPGWMDVAYSDIDIPGPRVNHSKSGAIVKESTSDGLYHMYFGDSFFYHATSPDLKNWTALPADNYFAAPLNPWENRLIEPGPAPIKTRDGRWILFYNGLTTGRVGYPQNQYSVGQMLIDPSGAFRPDLNTSNGKYQPALMDGPIARIEKPLLVPEAGDELNGQVDQVVFAEGIVQFKGKWFLYFGQADSEVGVATADVQA